MESKHVRSFRTFVQLTPAADVAAIAVRIPGIAEATYGIARCCRFLRTATPEIGLLRHGGIQLTSAGEATLST